MTCIHTHGMIVCGFHPTGRLHVGNRYITVEMHPYCGPSFLFSAYPNDPYDPVDENDPIWPEFYKWYKRHEAAKAKKEAQP